jgi:hypothetical protein
VLEVQIDPTIPLERVTGVEFAPVDGRPLLLDAAHPPAAALAGVTGDSGVPELEGAFGSPGYSSRVQAVVWCSGFADFFRPGGEVRYDNEWTARLFGGLSGSALAAERDLLRLASPLHHVGPGAPPFLFLHGTRDETTRFEQAVVLYEEIGRAHV